MLHSWEFITSLRWSRPLAATLICALSFALACSSSSPDEGTRSPSDSQDPEQSNDTRQDTIRFADSSTLTLSPGTSTDVSVIVSPAEKQIVTFEILTETAEFDGFLDKSEMRVGPDGQATITLRAPSGPAAFVLRASTTGGSEARRAISVSSSGYGSLVIRPQYEGKREITQWFASARAGITCSELELYWNDGPLLAISEPVATIPSVPSGTPLAVTVRGDGLASGCATVTDLEAGELRELSIEALDRAINVEEGELKFQMHLSATTTDFLKHFQDSIDSAVLSFRGELESDSQALLERIALRLDELDFGGAEFRENCDIFSLDREVDSLWGGEQVVDNELRTRLTGASKSVESDMVFRGRLSLRGDESLFSLENVGLLSATQAGFLAHQTWTVAPETSSTLIMGASLTYSPLSWLTAEAARLDDKTTLEDGLLSIVDCPALTSLLEATVGGPVSPTCGANCLQLQCEEATEDIWGTLRSDDSQSNTIQIGISGEALLIGPAIVDEFNGSWVGRVDVEETSMKGDCQATRIPSSL